LPLASASYDTPLGAVASRHIFLSVPAVHALPLCFSFPCSADPRDPHSFPTRRSSDLESTRSMAMIVVAPIAAAAMIAEEPTAPRSEEHTSELQSRFDLVCRLLLEKKNLRWVCGDVTIWEASGKTP